MKKTKYRSSTNKIITVHKKLSKSSSRQNIEPKSTYIKVSKTLKKRRNLMML
jgi:hypothetical protein